MLGFMLLSKVVRRLKAARTMVLRNSVYLFNSFDYVSAHLVDTLVASDTGGKEGINIRDE